jgi:hypothetical protein
LRSSSAAVGTFVPNRRSDAAAVNVQDAGMLITTVSAGAGVVSFTSHTVSSYKTPNGSSPTGAASAQPTWQFFTWSEDPTQGVSFTEVYGSTLTRQVRNCARPCAATLVRNAAGTGYTISLTNAVFVSQPALGYNAPANESTANITFDGSLTVDWPSAYLFQSQLPRGTNTVGGSLMVGSSAFAPSASAFAANSRDLAYQFRQTLANGTQRQIIIILRGNEVRQITDGPTTLCVATEAAGGVFPVCPQTVDVSADRKTLTFNNYLIPANTSVLGTTPAIMLSGSLTAAGIAP